jgi:cytochrome c-type biogenesis protein CcmH
VQTQLAQLGADPGALDQPASGEEGMPVTGGISATVSVASELAGLVRPGALLFVFARDGDKPGPPIAVKRMPVPQLPFTTTLTDADAMVEGASLGKADQLKLVARISLSGNPIAEPGDLYGEALVSGESGDSAVSVVIDRIAE